MKDISPKSANTVRRTSVGRSVNILSIHMNAEMSLRLKPHGLNLSSFALLMILFENEGSSQKELGAHISMPAYKITRAIDALETSGFVERQDDPNSRRSHKIFLTIKGRQMGPTVFNIVHEVNDWILGDLEGDEKQAFSQTLAKITTRLLHGNKKGSK